MGFFSKIKKIWKKETPEPEVEVKEPIEEVVEPESEPESGTEPARSDQEPPAAEPAPEPKEEQPAELEEIAELEEPAVEPESLIPEEPAETVREIEEADQKEVTEAAAELAEAPEIEPEELPEPILPEEEPREIEPKEIPEPVTEPEPALPEKLILPEEEPRVIEPREIPEPITEPEPALPEEPILPEEEPREIEPREIPEPVTEPEPALPEEPTPPEEEPREVEPEEIPEPITEPEIPEETAAVEEELLEPEFDLEEILDLEEMEIIEEEPKTAPEPAAEPPGTGLLGPDAPTWQRELLSALQNAEPRLSIWLNLILDGVEEQGDELWERLRFLFKSLEAPEQETEDFLARFAKWLDDMDYEYVEEFRSELQYRLALALDLEDEEDERSRLFIKLSAGLSKTKEQLSRRIDQLLTMNTSFDDEFWEEFEEILIMADVGVTATQKLMDRLRPRVRAARISDGEEFKALLKEELASLFRPAEPRQTAGPPEVVLMVGVNGAGKTTTIAKLAHRAQMQGKSVLVAAGDTFRAAAIEQLKVWADRVGAGFFAKEHGADPAAVAYEALDTAVAEGYDMVFVDTAGRLQTKVGLMEELKKIQRVLAKKMPEAPHRTILVLDATTGQNALSQVKLFSEAAPVSEIVLTKLDGTAKGGVIVAIALEHDIPISFVGLGEKMEDLRPFDGEDFTSALFG
jgi:fused signal recognition particle receptor